MLKLNFSKPLIKITFLFLFLNINLFLLVPLGYLLTACNTINPKLEPDLKLELKDVSCTEAWLQLTTNNIQLPVTINLLKNNTLAQFFNLNTKDSILYIDSLLPNQNYKFIIVANTTDNPQPTTNEVFAQTMDTTSHNFTFTSWTFGTIGSSVLYDVAIINENNIWAVGEIMIADTSLNGYTTYNALHWEGQNWELKRIKTNSCGGVDYPPIKAIFVFSSNDILFSHIDGSISHFNGIEFTNDCSLITQLNGSANKIWGRSRNDFYVVSGIGFIARYKNGNWTKIESGTTLNINDIWGDFNEKTLEWEILAVASNVNKSVERSIIKIENNTSQTISNIPIQWSLKTCWFIPMRKYFVAGSGIYEKHTLIQNQWANEALDITTYYTNRIRGNDINDVLGVGAFGDLVHFNGWQWKIDYTQPNLNFGSYLSVDFKNNILVAVGLKYNQAVILKGIR